MRNTSLASMLALLVLLGGGCPEEGTPAIPDMTQPDLALPPDLAVPDLTPDAPLPSLALVGSVKVMDNPNSVLSCFVSFTTNIKSLGFVEFQRTTDPATTYRIDTRVPATAHKILVFGMRAELAHDLVAGASVSRGTKETVRAKSIKYVTGKVPERLPRGEVLVSDVRRTEPGWTLMTLSAGDRENGTVTMAPYFVPTAVMYDMEGEIVWYREHHMPRLGDTRYMDGRVLAQSMGSINEPKRSALEFDLAGDVVWRGPMQPENTVAGHFNHHFERLPDGNYLTLKNAYHRKVIGDVIVIMRPDHRELWTWNTFDYIKPRMKLWDGKGNFDYTHGNSLVMDATEGVVYYNARHLSMVFKIQISTGKILWRLGQGGSFKMDATVKFPWFQQAHAVEVQPNGNILLYDNGLKSRGWSRAVEYALDEKKMTARVAWQYSGFPKASWSTLYWGDADRLPNGNTLITAGTWAKGQRSHVFEVTPDWKRVWEMRLPLLPNSGLSVGMYNSQRMRPPLTIMRGGKVVGPNIQDAGLGGGPDAR